MALFIENGFAETSDGADAFITSDVITTGGVQWVDSVNGSDANTGTESKPVATLQQAITNSTANNGDLIIVKSGHVQTLSTSITISKAGLRIYGIGNGSSAPQFTVAAAIDGFNITANNVEINNLYFPAGTSAANTSRINIDAANVIVKGCTFYCGAQDAETITLTANALYAKIISCSFTVSTTGPTKGISVESASTVGLYLYDLAMNGGTYNWASAAIYSAVAHLNFKYDTITLTGSAAITHSSTTAKGHMSNIIAGDGSVVNT